MTDEVAWLIGFTDEDRAEQQDVRKAARKRGLSSNLFLIGRQETTKLVISWLVCNCMAWQHKWYKYCHTQLLLLNAQRHPQTERVSFEALRWPSRARNQAGSEAEGQERKQHSREGASAGS